MSLRETLLGRVGEKGEVAAKREAIEISVLENEAEWAQEIASLKVKLRKAQNFQRAADADASVSAAEYVEIATEVYNLQASLKTAETAYATRFPAGA